MKYYSEVLNKFYDSEDELKKEELAEKRKAEQKVAEEIKKSHSLAAEKKKAASAVEANAGKLEDAYKNYIEVKKECSKLADECNKLVKEKMDAATSIISSCTADYNKSLRTFNERFGPYKKILKGDQAKTFHDISDYLFDTCFRPFFWFD